MKLTDDVSIALTSDNHGLTPRGFTVREHMDQLFTVDVLMRSLRPDVDLATPIGGPASLALRITKYMDATKRTWSGVCTHLRQERVEPEGMSTYRMIVRPDLWRLTQRRNHRLFQHMSIPSIVEKVLGEWSVEHRFEIDAGAYPDIELRVQYGETDYDFIKRLLEEVGISYSFDDAGGQSVLVMSDTPQSRDRRSRPLRFVDEMTAKASLASEYVTRLAIERRFQPNRVAIRDHDYRRPAFDLLGDATVGEEAAAYEQYHYRPGDFLHENNSGGETPTADDKGTARHDGGHGGQRATRLLELHQNETRRVIFETSVTDLAPGRVFNVEGHPHGELDDEDLLAIGLEIDAHEDEDWIVRGVAAFGRLAYRPPLETVKPAVYGVQSALVVGPVGDEIHTDEYGRVRVQFHWDREGQSNDGSSCWMRASQGWAGGGYGGLNIPRVGHEVLVAFLNGNPDQPIVVGRVFNEASPVPYKLPSNKTVSTWRSASSPQSGGFNEVRFDDSAGREIIYVQAEKDYTQLVKNNRMLVVGANRTQHVRGNDATTTSGNNLTVVKGNETATIGRSQQITIGASRHTNVTASDTSFVGSMFAVTIAPTMPAPLAAALEGAYQTMAPVLAASPASTLGQVPFSPLGAPFNGNELGPMANVVQTAMPLLSQFIPLGKKALKDQAKKGPPPTGISMVDKKIVLTTGGASIILDGADIILAAAGEIRSSAKLDHKVMSEEGDVLIQGGPMVRINPGVKPPEADCLKGAAKEGAAFIGGAR